MSAGEASGVMPARMVRRPMLSASGPPDPVVFTDRKRPALMPSKYPRYRELTAIQREAFSLVQLAVRTTSEVAHALAIEWPTAESTLDQLRKRLLVNRVHGYPVTWEVREDG